MNVDNKPIISSSTSNEVILGETKSKKTWVRRSSLLIPTCVAVWGLAYMVWSTLHLDVFVYWHPVLTSFVKVLFFPFYLLPESIFASTGIAPVPNFINVGIVFVSTIALFYILSYLVTISLFRLGVKRAGFITNGFLFIVVCAGSFALMNIERGHCVTTKEQNSHHTARAQLLSFGVSYSVSANQFNVDKEKMFSFYRSNNVRPVYTDYSNQTYVVMTGVGEEIETACRLETYPGISGVWPFAPTSFLGVGRSGTLWSDNRASMCIAYGVSTNVKFCTEYLISRDNTFTKKIGTSNYIVTDDGTVRVSVQ